MNISLTDGKYAIFDVGTQSLKAVIVERQNGKNRLASIERVDFKPSGDFPGDHEFLDHQIQMLRQLAAKMSLGQCRDCLAIFNNRELQVKIIDLPREIQQTQEEGVLLWEAKKLLSPNMRNEPYVFGYRRVRESAPSFILGVVPQSRLQKMHEMFERAGIKLSGAYPEVFGAMAIKEALPSTTGAALSLINLGHNNTHLQIFSAGDLKFYRHIPSGIGELPDDLSPRELEVFAQKIRFSFDYFRAVTKLSHIEEILFMGGGAAHKELFAYSRDYFAPGKVAKVDLASVFDVSPVLAQLQAEPESLLAFLPALGTFLGHGGSEAAHYNFCHRLQKVADQERFKTLMALMPIVIAVISFFFGCAVLVFWHGQVSESRNQAKEAAGIAELGAAAARTKTAKFQAAPVRNDLSPDEKRRLGHLVQDRLSGGQILFKIAQARPPGLNLLTLTIQDRNEEMAEDAEELPPPPQEAEIPQGDGDVGIPGGHLKVIPPEEKPQIPPEIASAADVASPPVIEAPLQKSSPMPSPLSREEPLPKAETPDKAVSEIQIESLEDLGREVIVMKGVCAHEGLLLGFLAKLKEVRLVQRYRLFQSSRKAGEPVKFTLVGELP